MRISRLAEGLQMLGSDKQPNFWKKRFVPFLSPQKGPRPSGEPAATGAGCLQMELQIQAGWVAATAMG